MFTFEIPMHMFDYNVKKIERNQSSLKTAFIFRIRSKTAKLFEIGCPAENFEGMNYLVRSRGE